MSVGKSKRPTTPAYTKETDRYRLAKLWRSRGTGGSGDSGIMVACTSETGNVETGVARTFYLPYSVVIEEVIADVVTAPTGASIVVDVHVNDSTILSTKPQIQASEVSSLTGTTAVISSAAHSKGDKVEIIVDQVGSTAAGAGLKVAILWSRV